MPVGLLPATAKCYKLTSFSAPSEWILALCWITYLYALGYDLYHAETVAMRMISLASQRGARYGKSPNAEMRQLRLARVLGSENEDTGYKSDHAMVGHSKYAPIQSQDIEV